MTADANAAGPEGSAGRRRLGFWAAWSMTVGVMIGSGIFTLPALLAPKGLLGFGGWLISGGGAICLAVTLARLAAKTQASGGPFVYVQEAFGDFAGFLMAWAYWCSYWAALPAIAIAFIGYFSVFVPGADQNAPLAIATGLALIWLLTLNAARGVRSAAFAQIAMTFLKIAPLLVVIALGAASGSRENFPPLNPEGSALFPLFAATSLVTMWAFSGLEAATLPAGAIRNAERVVPRALLAGVLTVTAIYLAATAAVMALVPMERLAVSASPFAEAARGLGPAAPYLVALGAMISTAGAINGSLIVCGEVALAAAERNLAPGIFARLSDGGAPATALVISAALGSILLILNYSRGFVAAFEFLILMSTIAFAFPLLASAFVELRQSVGRSLSGAGAAALAALYCCFIILGAGGESLFWGLVLTVAGAPVHFLVRGRRGGAGDAPIE